MTLTSCEFLQCHKRIHQSARFDECCLFSYCVKQLTRTGMTSRRARVTLEALSLCLTCSSSPSISAAKQLLTPLSPSLKCSLHRHQYRIVPNRNVSSTQLEFLPLPVKILSPVHSQVLSTNWLLAIRNFSRKDRKKYYAKFPFQEEKKNDVMDLSFLLFSGGNRKMQKYGNDINCDEMELAP